MRRLLLALTMAATICSLAAAPAPAQNKTPLKIGYMPIGDCLQLYVAQGLGYFAEEGLNVTATAMKGGAVIAPAVEGGAVDIGWSNTVSIILSRAKGFDFVFLAPGAVNVEGTNDVHSLLVPKNSPLASIKELGGKTVAINTLGNINELAIRALAEENGVDFGAIRLVEIPFPDMEAALAKNAVDAALVIEPFVTAAVTAGTAKILERSAHKAFGARYMIGGWFAKAAWVKAHPQEAAAFVRVAGKASTAMAKDPAGARRFLAVNTGIAMELAEKISLPAFFSEFTPDDLQRMIDVTAKYGLIPAPFPAAEIMAKIGQ